MRKEILKFMGHKGEVSEQLEEMISLCLKMLADVCTLRHVIMKFVCAVNGDSITFETCDGGSQGVLVIKSSALAVNLNNCEQAYIFAATLGAGVDRLLAQRVKIDSAEALCLQACAAAQIEDYCNSIERELSHNISGNGLCLRPRFSPGFGDFDIAHQTDILRILEAHKHAGITETKTHILAPLKSVTAVIGVKRN